MGWVSPNLQMTWFCTCCPGPCPVSERSA